MTIDTAVLLQHLQSFDWTAAAIGAAAARSVEAAIVQTVKRAPALAIGLLRKRIQALAAAGKIDAPTMKLLRAYAKATFDWVDEELPDEPGPEKMQAALDHLAGVPYVGVIVRADRAGVQQILQAAYDAINQEAKAGAAALGGPSDASTPAKDAPALPPAPPPAPAAGGGSPQA